MKKPAVFATLAVLFLLSPPLLSMAQEKSGTKKGEPSGKSPKGDNEKAKAKEESYSVVEVGEEVKLIKDSEYTDMMKKVDAKFEEEMKAYNEAKKQATRANRPLKKAKPVKPEVIRHRFKTEAEATAARDKLVEKKKAEELYAVVEVGEELKLMKKSELETFEKSLDTQYTRQLEAYNKAKKEAEKDRQKFTQTKPVKKKFKVINNSLKGEKEAQAFLDKSLEEKRSKKPG